MLRKYKNNFKKITDNFTLKISTNVSFLGEQDCEFARRQLNLGKKLLKQNSVSVRITLDKSRWLK